MIQNGTVIIQTSVNAKPYETYKILKYLDWFYELCQRNKLNHKYCRNQTANDSIFTVTYSSLKILVSFRNTFKRANEMKGK
jgi:hypothetical protein